MNFDVYIFLRFVMIFFIIFFSILCSVLRVSSESDPSHRDRSVSVPAESAAKTETLNHEWDWAKSQKLEFEEMNILNPIREKNSEYIKLT